MAVGCNRDVERLTRSGAHPGKLRDHLDQALPQQWLAARQTNLANSQPDEHASHSHIVRYRQLRKLRTINSRPAIHTLVIAPVRDRDAQIADAPSEFVV